MSCKIREEERKEEEKERRELVFLLVASVVTIQLRKLSRFSFLHFCLNAMRQQRDMCENRIYGNIERLAAHTAQPPPPKKKKNFDKIKYFRLWFWCGRACPQKILIKWRQHKNNVQEIQIFIINLSLDIIILRKWAISHILYQKISKNLQRSAVQLLIPNPHRSFDRSMRKIEVWTHQKRKEKKWFMGIALCHEEEEEEGERESLSSLLFPKSCTERKHWN